MHFLGFRSLKLSTPNCIPRQKILLGWKETWSEVKWSHSVFSFLNRNFLTIELKLQHSLIWLWTYVQVFITFISEVSEVAQSCPTLCDPMDCSPPGSSIQGILQARILELVVISFSRGSSQCRDQTLVSHTAGRLFTVWAAREAPTFISGGE